MKTRVLLAVAIVVGACLPVLAQNAGVIQGNVVLRDKNLGLHNATVLISELGRSTNTADDGSFEFQDVPPGTYNLLVTAAGLSSDIQTAVVIANQTAMVDFNVTISPIRQDVTVTATGAEQVAFESFQTVTSLDSFDLAGKTASSLGEVLDNQPGVTKRSSGPGTARPVIRGFDGDRVLIMEDGVGTGTLSSQSGDHGEPLDVMNVERLEVVKGPATLLYGSNAIGGVVNAVSRHFQIKEQSEQGIRGYLTGGGGSNSGLGAGGAGFEYGARDWLVWAGGGNQKTRDYKTKEGTVVNSGTRLTNGTGGLGWFGKDAFASANYGYDDGIYGIPLEEGETPVRLAFIRRNARFSAGANNLGTFVDGIRGSFKYSGWNHQEIEFLTSGPEVATRFNNKQYSYQVFLDQRKTGRLSGTLGFQGSHRDYKTSGEEAIAPPVKGDIAAVFGLEELQFDRFKLQLGLRVENTRFRPVDSPDSPDRTFTGVSGAFGIHVPLWQGGALVTNYTHSSRSPAIEELYNNGPHQGNLAFEIGNPNLKLERSDGIDVSVRHARDRFTAEGNFFLYRMANFVFLAPTGGEVDGLTEALYTQGDSRYTGTEINFNYGFHPNLWLDGGLDYVNAKLLAGNTPLPRIPPLRGRIGIDARYKGFSVKPEVIMTHAQNEIFTTETRTAGYTVIDLTASYTLPQQHLSHYFSVNAFNLGDRLYRSHISFIKDIAPEIGRGVRVTYSVKFF